MKYLIVLIAFFMSIKCYSQNKERYFKNDTLRNIKKCFSILDSLAKKTGSAVIANNGIYSINYLAEVSGIAPSSDGTYAGYLYCTREDLKKWHEWFNRYAK